jgi:DNA-binding response OmpR family regulator
VNDGPMRILLVEDEQTIAVTLRDDLEGVGYEVEHCADGKPRRSPCCSGPASTW